MGNVLNVKKKIRPEGDVLLAAKIDCLRQGFFRRCKLASFIEFPVIRQIRFDGRTQNTSPVYHHATVVQAVICLQRSADHKDEFEFP